MAIQIRGVQIQDGSIGAGKLDLTGTYDFSSGTLQAGTPSADADVATKGYVDGLMPDSFAGGDGISITDGAGSDTIAVDLATNSGLQFTSNKLDMDLADSTLTKDSEGVKVKLKVESGGSLSSDVNGIYIADGAISNAKLANSTISGVALGSSLNALSAGQGISMTSYDGSAAVSDITINIDGSTLAKSASGLKVADGGITSTQIGDGQVSAAKCGFEGAVDFFTPDGSTASFALNAEVPSDFFGMVLAYKNGLLMKGVESSPADADEYSVSTTGGVTSVVFGANLSSSDTLQVRSFAIKSA
jgi:hypothetical protein